MSEPHIHTWEARADAEDGIAAIQGSWLPYVPFLGTLQEDRPPERRRRLEVLPMLGPRVIQER